MVTFTAEGFYFINHTLKHFHKRLICFIILANGRASLDIKLIRTGKTTELARKTRYSVKFVLNPNHIYEYMSKPPGSHLRFHLGRLHRLSRVIMVIPYN